MPKMIPQGKRLKPKKGFDIVTVKNAKGDEVRQRYVKRGTAARKAVTDKPGTGDATGTGGRQRDKTVMSAVDRAVSGT